MLGTRSADLSAIQVQLLWFFDYFDICHTVFSCKIKTQTRTSSLLIFWRPRASNTFCRPVCYPSSIVSYCKRIVRERIRSDSTQSKAPVVTFRFNESWRVARSLVSSHSRVTVSPGFVKFVSSIRKCYFGLLAAGKSESRHRKMSGELFFPLLIGRRKIPARPSTNGREIAENLGTASTGKRKIDFRVPFFSRRTRAGNPNYEDWIWGEGVDSYFRIWAIG